MAISPALRVSQSASDVGAGTSATMVDPRLIWIVTESAEVVAACVVPYHSSITMTTSKIPILASVRVRKVAASKSRSMASGSCGVVIDVSPGWCNGSCGCPRVGISEDVVLRSPHEQPPVAGEDLSAKLALFVGELVGVAFLRRILDFDDVPDAAT